MVKLEKNSQQILNSLYFKKIVLDIVHCTVKLKYQHFVLKPKTKQKILYKSTYSRPLDWVTFQTAQFLFCETMYNYYKHLSAQLVTTVPRSSWFVCRWLHLNNDILWTRFFHQNYLHQNVGGSGSKDETNDIFWEIHYITDKKKIKNKTYWSTIIFATGQNNL